VQIPRHFEHTVQQNDGNLELCIY